MAIIQSLPNLNHMIQSLPLGGGCRLIRYARSAATQQKHQMRTQERTLLSTQLKLAIPVPQPTPWIQTV